MGLSKSMYMETISCSKRGWLTKHKQEERVSAKAESLMASGHEVGDAAKKLFGDYVEVQYEQNKQLMIDQTLMLIADENVRVIAEAAFASGGCYCQADLLVCNDDGSFSVYEVKGTTKVKPYHLDDMAFQYHVITSQGFEVRDFYHIHIDSSYIREEELDLDKLFVIQDCTEDVLEGQDGIREKISKVKEALAKKEEPDVCIGMKCKDPTECPYFEYCTRDLPENNVFDLAGMGFKKKVELFYKGIITFKDVSMYAEDEKIGAKQCQQVKAEIDSVEASYNTGSIEKFLNGLTLPLYFLDFETYQQAIPLYEDVSPFSQVVFQYSLHYIEGPGGKLQHRECLGTPPEDPRYKVAKQLCEDIPMGVTTLAYNMSFERMVLAGLANLYPEFYIHLMDIRENMKDLMVPFQKRYYYNRKFNGSYSIKVVLPVLFPDDPSLDYHNLDEEVQNGSMAMAAYAAMASMEDKEKIKKIRHCLLCYCELDTFAMVKIWQFLMELVGRQAQWI